MDLVAGTDLHVTRRRLLALSGATLAAAATGTTFAPPALAEDVVLSDQQMLSYLDNAAWVPDGPASERHVYVGSAPWCPNCKALHKRLRSYSGSGVQFRWIQGFSRDRTSERQNMAAAVRRDPNDLAALYGSGKMPGADGEDARWLANWNDGLINALRHTMKGRLGRYATPVVIWPTSGGLTAALGADVDVDGILQRVAARPDAKDIVPAATKFPGTVTGEKSIAPTALYASKRDVPLFAVPDASAPMVWRLAVRHGAKATRVATTRDRRRWAYFHLWTSGSFTSGGWANLDDLYLRGGRKAVL